MTFFSYWLTKNEHRFILNSDLIMPCHEETELNIHIEDCSKDLLLLYPRHSPVKFFNASDRTHREN